MLNTHYMAYTFQTANDIKKTKKLYIETDLQGMCGPNFSSFGSAQL